MPTFVDESGDTGDPLQGGKPYFRMAAVWMSVETLDNYRTYIRQLRTTLGLNSTYEFKFHSSRHDIKRAFLEAIGSCPFQFAVCSVNKIHPDWMKASRLAYYWVTTTTLAASMQHIYFREEEQHQRLCKDPVVVDNNDDGEYLQLLKDSFRGLKSRISPAASLVGKVQFRKSKPDEAIQLADFLCGAYGAFLDGDVTWFDAIKNRCIDACVIP